MTRYVAVNEKGEVVTITIETLSQGVASAPEPVKVKEFKGHKLKPGLTLDAPVECSCGAEGYVCKKCKKVLCNNLNGVAVDGLCPKCVNG